MTASIGPALNTKSDLSETSIGQINDIGGRVDARWAELEQLCHMPYELLQGARNVGLFELLTTSRPRDEKHLTRWFETSTRCAWWNGSLGWLVGQGSAIAAIVATSAPALFEQICSSTPQPIIAGTNAGVVTIERHESSWRANGAIRFTSGCKGATHIAGLAIEAGEDPSPETRRYVLAPMDSWEIIEDWDVVGLRGTGSHSIRANSMEIDDDSVFWELKDPPTNDPLRAINVTIAGAWGIAFSVASTQLGIARRALDECYVVVATKHAPPQFDLLDERPTVRATLMELEGLWLQAYAACETVLETLWTAALLDCRPTDHQRALLATTAHLANQRATDIVQAIWRLVGTSALAPSHPIARCARDVQPLVGHIAANTAVLGYAATRYRGEDPGNPIA